jgi:hypothetical protein
MLCVSQIDQRDRKLFLIELLISKTFERSFGSSVHQILECCCRCGFLGVDGGYEQKKQQANAREAFDRHLELFCVCDFES